tara:strand:+ start:1359 stop:3821 length:2463 start_codon:yes stop_codon:yes gene_type:complete
MDFKHIFLENKRIELGYSGSGRGNFKKFERAISERVSHGTSLVNSINSFFPEERPVEYISEAPGTYIEILSVPGFELAIESLDTRECKLCNLRVEGEQWRATVLIFDDKRTVFTNKLQRYIGQAGGQTNDTLFDNIAEVRLAQLSDFWTSSPSRYPGSEDEVIWWEVWLRRISLKRQEIEEFKEYCKNQNITVSGGLLEFEFQSVLCVNASANQLKGSVALISCLVELRRIVDTANFLLSQQPIDQAEWADLLLEKTSYIETPTASILIFDSGVDYNHPLISPSLQASDCYKWNVDWPDYDSGNVHGTLQAGLSIYGDIAQAILSDEAISVTYQLESCRVLPPLGVNEKELYGSLTYYAVKEAEKNAKLNRVVSIAITADHDGITGQPTSWSSEIDYLAFDAEGTRLFVISGGNVRGDDVGIDYREATAKCSIEDPGQAWNAITVGAYTQMTDVSEWTYKDWSALSNAGDISPTSRTSLEWGWRKEAPLKPDIVEEGGNLIISPDKKHITNADCVSLVTTGDHTKGRFFIDHRETSAATALTSRLAANVWSQYPEYWSETIRALIIHSASWTDAMWNYKDLAVAQGLLESDAKEIVLRMFGHGVPSLDRALASKTNYLTMVVQDFIYPYKLKDGRLGLNEMHLIELPWPQAELLALGNAKAKLRVTLSYYIEPNPGRRAYTKRFRYQSHGLRFKLNQKNESSDDFVARINLSERPDNYEAGGVDNSGWCLKERLRTRGTIHQDTWEGSASDLALRNLIAVVPIAGWWSQSQKALTEKRDQKPVAYSLVVSLEVDSSDVDIYSPVAVQVGIDNPIAISVLT